MKAIYQILGRKKNETEYFTDLNSAIVEAKDILIKKIRKHKELLEQDPKDVVTLDGNIYIHLNWKTTTKLVVNAVYNFKIEGSCSITQNSYKSVTIKRIEAFEKYSMPFAIIDREEVCAQS